MKIVGIVLYPVQYISSPYFLTDVLQLLRFEKRQCFCFPVIGRYICTYLGLHYLFQYIEIEDCSEISLTLPHASNTHRNTLKTDTPAGIEGALHTMLTTEESLLGAPWALCLDHGAIKETSWGVESYFQGIMSATMIGNFTFCMRKQY